MLSRGNRCWATRQTLRLCHILLGSTISIVTSLGWYGWHFSTKHFSNHFWLRRVNSWEWFWRELQSHEIISQTGFFTVATWFATDSVKQLINHTNRNKFFHNLTRKSSSNQKRLISTEHDLRVARKVNETLMYCCIRQWRAIFLSNLVF